MLILLKAHSKVFLESLREFLATESPLKMMENAFFFTLKALFVLKVFKFLSSLFTHAEKMAWLKEKVNFKIYDVTTWLTNNYNTYIAQYLKNYRQPGNEICSVNRIKHEKHFSWKIIQKIWGRNFSQTLKNQNWAYFWINSLMFYAACFYYMLSWGLSKYSETKLQTTCLYLI